MYCPHNGSMSTLQEIAPPKVRWDLSALFASMDDPRIEASWTKLMVDCDAFAEKYRGKINPADLSASTLAQALKEIEGIVQEAAKPATYAQLLFSCDSASANVGAFMQKQMERSSELSVKLMFFE